MTNSKSFNIISVCRMNLIAFLALNIKLKTLIFTSILFINFNFGNIYSQEIKLTELRDKVNKSYYSFDRQLLKTTLNSTEDFITKNPDNYYGYYYNGIIRYCLGRVLYNTDSDIAYDYFDSSLEMFEKAYSINKNAVVIAMISAAYGKKSALAPLSSIFFGQKAKNRIYDAFNLDSANSKILLVAATHLMHVPGFYGGDKVKARKMLLKCLSLNKNTNQKDEFELYWADDAEIYAYLAQIDILEEKVESAREYMKKALAIQPDYGFVKIDLENQIIKLK